MLLKVDERLLLLPVGDSGFVWSLLSPEGVVTVEDLRRVEGVRVVPVGGGRPQHTVGKINIFTEKPSAEDMATHMAEARVLSAEFLKADVPAALLDADDNVEEFQGASDLDPAPPPAPIAVDVLRGVRRRLPHKTPVDSSVPAPGIRPPLVPSGNDGGAPSRVAPARAGFGWFYEGLEICDDLEPGDLLDGLYESCVVMKDKGISRCRVEKRCSESIDAIVALRRPSLDWGS